MSDGMDQDLLHGWQSAISDLGGRADAARVESAGQALLLRWREPHRAYHTVEHLSTCLNVWQGLPWSNAPAAAIALWYHDAIYDPRASDNEARSAALAQSDLVTLGVPASSIEAVVRLILATDHRTPPHDDDADAVLLVDVDLAILAADPTVYAVYARNIRHEYAHVSDEAYRLGRSKVLRVFLARERIFRHPRFHPREAAARTNLTAELSRLD